VPGGDWPIPNAVKKNPKAAGRPSASPVPSPPGKAFPALPALTLVALGLFVYYPTLQATWVWDDSLLITGNTVVHDPWGLWKIWFAPSQVDYFPLVTSGHWLLWQIFGDQPWAFHFVNIALHLGSGFLLWRLLAQLGVRLAWVGGLLWVVHPLAVESVAQASELKNTLSQFLALASMIAFVTWTTTPRRKGLYRAALGLFVAAMLSKTSVVMLPFVLLLYVWWKNDRITKPDLHSVLPFFGAALAFGLVTIWYQDYHGIGDEYVPAGGFATRCARAGLAQAFYLLKCLVPGNLMPMYPRWTVNPPTLVQFLPWPLLAAALGWFWTRRATWGRHALLGVGFFLLNLLPVLGFVTMAYMWVTWTADHLAYLSLVGIIGLVTAGFGVLWVRQSQFQKSLAAVGAAVILLLAWLAHNYTAVFHNPETLFTYAVKANPDAWLAHRSLAQIARDHGNENAAQDQMEAAAQSQKKAIAANPHDPVAFYQLGVVRQQQGQLSDAYAQFQKALELKPDYVGAHANLGYIMFLYGRADDAKAQFVTALQYGNHSAEIRYNLGYVLFTQGHFEEARTNFLEALRLKPDHVDARLSLAQTYENLHRPADALREYQEALRQLPNNNALREKVNQLTQK